MRTLARAALSLAAVFCLFGVTPPAGAQVRDDNVYREVRPLVEWSGMPVDAELRKAAPANNLIDEPQAWEELWKAWRGGEETPQVDFERAVVLVYTAQAQNLPLAKLFQSRPGILVVRHGQTLRGGPGFGYRMLLLARDEIKLIDGQPLPPPGGERPESGSPPARD